MQLCQGGAGWLNPTPQHSTLTAKLSWDILYLQQNQTILCLYEQSSNTYLEILMFRPMELCVHQSQSDHVSAHQLTHTTKPESSWEHTISLIPIQTQTSGLPWKLQPVPDNIVPDDSTSCPLGDHWSLPLLGSCPLLVSSVLHLARITLVRAGTTVIQVTVDESNQAQNVIVRAVQEDVYIQEIKSIQSQQDIPKAAL